MNLRKGVNLGMWLAQFPQKGDKHFRTYIQKSDFEAIADLGFDHVRVPFDHVLLEDGKKNPVLSKNKGLYYLDFAVDNAQRVGLKVILDLHKGPGFSFDQLADNNLFDSSDCQEQFVSVWETLAERYQAEGDSLIFELLNEVVEGNSERWNHLARRTVEAIRRYGGNRPIIVGSNQYASVEELSTVWVSDDPLVWYTFHFYEPLLVTHPKAHWNELTSAYDRGVPYPGSAIGIDEFLKTNPKFGPLHDSEYWNNDQPQILDRAFLEKKIVKAKQFKEKSGKTALCGEFGVYYQCDDCSSLRWVSDVLNIFESENIPWTWWNWKSDDFGIYTTSGAERVKGLVELLTKNMS